MSDRKEKIEVLQYALSEVLSEAVEDKEDLEYLAEEIFNFFDYSKENMEEAISEEIIKLDILEKNDITLYMEDILEKIDLIKKGKLEVPKEEEEEEGEKLAEGQCPMCLRDMVLTWHHLIPRTCHKKYMKKGWTKDVLSKNGVNVCRECHNNIHRLIKNEELAEKCSTFKLLMDHPRIVKFIPYIRKQKPPKIKGLYKHYKK